MYSSRVLVMMAWLVVVLLAVMASPALAGHFLLWLPLSSKSMKIGVMACGEELARRGHQVTVVSAWPGGAVQSGITDINIPSEWPKLEQQITEDLLVGGRGLASPMQRGLEVSITDNKAALTSPALWDLLANNPVDVVVTFPVFGNEAAYYLAHRQNASLALFITGMVTLPWAAWATGDTFHPAYMPLGFTTYSQEMTFPQRLFNTLATVAVKFVVRDLIVVPRVEAMLSEVFPEEEIPSLHTLARAAALTINHGSPFLGDGLRPVMPQTVLAGLMTCRPRASLPGLPPDLAEWVETAPNGVIFVSFGSVIKASKENNK